MKLTIDTNLKRFKFRKVTKYTIGHANSGDHVIEIVTKKGTKSLILPSGSINWIRRD